MMEDNLTENEWNLVYVFVAAVFVFVFFVSAWDKMQ
jgi:hypothetical protein